MQPIIQAISVFGQIQQAEKTPSAAAVAHTAVPNVISVHAGKSKEQRTVPAVHAPAVHAPVVHAPSPAVEVKMHAPQAARVDLSAHVMQTVVAPAQPVAVDPSRIQAAAALAQQKAMAAVEQLLQRSSISDKKEDKGQKKEGKGTKEKSRTEKDGHVAVGTVPDAASEGSKKKGGKRGGKDSGDGASTVTAATPAESTSNAKPGKKSGDAGSAAAPNASTATTSDSPSAGDNKPQPQRQRRGKAPKADTN